MLVRTMHPWNAHTCSGLGAWQTNKKQTPHFRTYSRRSSPNFAWW